MGDLIHLDKRRSRRTATAVAFFFDVACPLSYLAAERVERTLGAVDWVPVDRAMLDPCDDADWAGARALRSRAESCARRSRLPLVWPEAQSAGQPWGLPGARRARRACLFACELGAGAAFALAAGRLAFCGGFDLDDPETLAEAAAAAGVPLEACLEAAGETWRDEQLDDAAELLREHGVGDLPAVQVDGRWLEGAAAVFTGVPRAGRSRR
ncbi:MAG: DsbA family protein [Solirubrobacteraceae bacterium]